MGRMTLFQDYKKEHLREGSKGKVKKDQDMQGSIDQEFVLYLRSCGCRVANVFDPG
jgi:hypothetical protein